MTRTLLDRRTFLAGLGKAAGAAMIGLPLLESMGCQQLTEGLSRESYGLEGAPKRIIFMWHPDGTVMDAFRPTSTAGGLELGPILAPLQSHAQDLLVLSGLDLEVRKIARETGFPKSGHACGAGCMLSGTMLQKGDLFTGGGGPSGWGGGISLDQHIANHIGNATPFRSLELGVQVRKNDVYSRISYQGPAQPLPPENSPYAVFERLFKGIEPGGGDTGPSEQELAELARRQSVLDLVHERYRALSARLGAADRTRLEAHMTAIEELESRLAGGGSGEPTASCGAPALGAPVDFMQTANYPKIGTLQLDLLSMAFACDLTRVATIQWSRSVNGQTYPWLGINKGHHEISHINLTDATARSQMIAINRYYAEQLAYLIDRLKAIPEGDGTVFDNTVIAWFVGLSNGNSHTTDDLPIVLAGKLGGAFQTGRALSFPGRSNNDLLISLMNAMGIPGDSFGDERACNGPLAGLAG